HDLLPPGDDHAGCGTRERQGVGLTSRLFLRVRRFLRYDRVLLKEPLSRAATHSAFTVIDPIDRDRHGGLGVWGTSEEFGTGRRRVGRNLTEAYSFYNLVHYVATGPPGN